MLESREQTGLEFVVSNVVWLYIKGRLLEAPW